MLTQFSVGLNDALVEKQYKHQEENNLTLKSPHEDYNQPEIRTY